MDIFRVLPKNQYDAALNAASPDAANPFATIADVFSVSLTATRVPYADTANSLADTNLQYDSVNGTWGIGLTPASATTLRIQSAIGDNVAIDAQTQSGVDNKIGILGKAVAQGATSHEIGVCGRSNLGAVLGHSTGIAGVVSLSAHTPVDGFIGGYFAVDYNVVGRTDPYYGVYGQSVGASLTARNYGGFFNASGATPGNHALVTSNGNVGFGTITPAAANLVHIDNGIAALTNPFVVTSSGGTDFFILLNTERIQYVDGNQALGKILTSDGSGIGTWQVPKTTDLKASYEIDAVESNDGSFTVHARFGFDGTTVLGVPTAIKGVLSSDTCTGRWRVYDVTNAAVIATTAVIASGSSPTITDFGALTNLPAAAAIFEIQGIRDSGSGGNFIHLDALTIKF